MIHTKHIITIVGNIGSGKTTALPFVAKALSGDIIAADDLFQTQNPFRDYYLQSIPRWGFTNELWMTHKRVKLIETAISQSKKDYVVIDSGLIMSWVYTKGHALNGTITPEEWNFFNELFTQWSSFALKTTLLYLTAPTDVLWKRIKKRGRDYEQTMYKPTHLEELEIGLQDLTANFAGVFEDIIRLDYTEIGNLTRQKAQKEFMHLIQKKFSYSVPSIEKKNPLLS